MALHSAAVSVPAPYWHALQPGERITRHVKIDWSPPKFKHIMPALFPGSSI
ncbi:hypothetical protein BCEP4_950005 [Burkholderia cepacia]|nr:hypothetical protein BCEP4_950005 [Burkholderia cepacia]